MLLRRTTVSLLAALCGRCEPSTASGPYEPCSEALPCEATLVCRGITAVAGATGAAGSGRLCTMPCANDYDCPLPSTGGAARVCATIQGATGGVCLVYCATDGDCLPGTLCRASHLQSGEETRSCVP